MNSMHRKYYIMLVWLCCQLMMAPVYANIDSLTYQQWLSEGKRQLQELISYNQQQEESENKVYFFSVMQDDDWIGRLGVGTTIDPEGTPLPPELIELNSRLQNINSESDFTFYVCLTEHLLLKAEPSFSVEGQPWANIQNAYSALGDEESADGVGSFIADWRKLMQAILSGEIQDQTESQGVAIDFVRDQNRYNEFIASDNRILLSHVSVLWGEWGEDENQLVNISLNSHHPTGSYFDENEGDRFEAIHHHIENGMQEGYEGVGNLVRMYELYYEFLFDDEPVAVGGGGSANGVVNVDEDGVVYPLPELFNTVFASAQPSDGNLPTVNVQNDLLNPDEFLFDYTNNLFDQQDRDELNPHLSGSELGGDSKLKIFITSSNTPGDIVAQLSGGGLTFLDDETNILHLHFDEETGRLQQHYHFNGNFNGALQEVAEKFLYYLQEYIAAHTFVTKSVLKLALKGVNILCNVIAKVIKYAELPPYIWNCDHPEYNPIFANFFALAPLGDPLSPFLGIIGLIDPENTSDGVKHRFAFFCGLWNGIVDELAGLPQLGKLLTDYILDKEKRRQINEAIGKVTFASIWEALKQAHPQDQLCKLNHQVGKDVVAIATIFAAVGALTKVGKANKIIKALNTIGDLPALVARLMQKLKALGFTMKQVQGKIEVYWAGVKRFYVEKILGEIRIDKFNAKIEDTDFEFIDVPSEHTIVYTGNQTVAGELALIRKSDGEVLAVPKKFKNFFETIKTRFDLGGNETLIKKLLSIDGFVNLLENDHAFLTAIERIKTSGSVGDEFSHRAEQVLDAIGNKPDLFFNPNEGIITKFLQDALNQVQNLNLGQLAGTSASIQSKWKIIRDNYRDFYSKFRDEVNDRYTVLGLYNSTLFPEIGDLSRTRWDYHMSKLETYQSSSFCGRSANTATLKMDGHPEIIGHSGSQSVAGTAAPVPLQKATINADGSITLHNLPDGQPDLYKVGEYQGFDYDKLDPLMSLPNYTARVKGVMQANNYCRVLDSEPKVIHEFLETYRPTTGPHFNLGGKTIVLESALAICPSCMRAIANLKGIIEEGGGTLVVKEGKFTPFQ